MGRPRKHRTDLPQRVYHHHGSHFFVDGTGKWHNLGKNFADAMIRYGELMKAPPAVSMTVGALLDRYQREVVPTKAPRTQRDNAAELAKLRQAFGHMVPTDVTPQDIYAYLDARTAKVRANREKALLSSVFSYAIRWGVMTSNPCRDVKSHKEAPRRRYIEDAEFRAVYDVAPDAVRAAMALSLLTGLRQGDVLRLRWSAVTESGLEVETAKTGKRLVFEWTPALRYVVESLRPGAGATVSGTTLIRTRSETPYTLAGFKAIWQRVIRKAHADGLVAERFTFHDIRAKAGSEAADEKLLGHQDQRTLNRHYRRAPERVTPLR